MIKTLIGIQLSGIWKNVFHGSKKAVSGGKKALYILVALLSLSSIFFSSGIMFYQLAANLATIGLGWVYFTFVGFALLALCFVGTIFAAQSQIYNAKDNDLLLAMPIKPKHILLSRIVSLLIINYIYTAVIALPAGVVYAISANIGAVEVILFIIGTLLLPILSLAASCVGGWLVGIVTSKMKSKNLITVVFMVVMLMAYMAFMTNVQTYITKLIESGEEIGRSVARVLPMLYSYGKACAEGDILQLFTLAAFCIIPFVIVYLVLSKSFIKIATTKQGINKKAYVKKELSVKSARTALLKKEFARFFSLPTYILNSGIGIVFEILLAVAVIFNPNSLQAVIGELIGLEEYHPIIACGLLAFCASMNCMTAPSISLEGKNIGLLKSLPVDPMEIYNAKILMNIILGIPSVIFAGIAFWVVFGLNLSQGLLVIIITSLVQAVSAVFGLCANILFPKFDWVNETAAIKQSMSAIIAVFGNMFIAAAPIIIGTVLHYKGFISMLNSLIIIAAIFAVLLAIFYIFILKKGRKLFMEF